jgi:hypothetical protein
MIMGCRIVQWFAQRGSFFLARLCFVLKNREAGEILQRKKKRAESWCRMDR